MRKLMIYIILLAAVLLAPKQNTELSHLKPVETVYLHLTGENIVIETDTEDAGKGTTVTQALQNLRDTSSGTVYLDTAEYLLVEKGAEKHVPELKNHLKRKTKICWTEEGVRVKDAAEFLKTHKPSMDLKRWQSGSCMEVLRQRNGRWILE